MQIMSLYQHVGIARFYYPGETIFRQGDPADEMYLVLEGLVEVQHTNRPAEIVGASSILAARALLDGYRCDATAIASNQWHWCRLQRHVLHYWFSRCHSLPLMSYGCLLIADNRLSPSLAGHARAHR